MITMVVIILTGREGQSVKGHRCAVASLHQSLVVAVYYVDCQQNSGAGTNDIQQIAQDGEQADYDSSQHGSGRYVSLEHLEY